MTKVFIKQRFAQRLLASASIPFFVVSSSFAANVEQMTPEQRVKYYREHFSVIYAREIERGFETTAQGIRKLSSGPTDWSPATIPPLDPFVQWRKVWTKTGLRARYCDETLLVYHEEEHLKGIDEHRYIQSALPTHVKVDGMQLEPLSWMEGQAISGSRSTITRLPDCMVNDYNTPLPSGRAVRVGVVIDPYLNSTDFNRVESKTEACPAGEHGQGMTWVRRYVQKMNEYGDKMGDPVYAPWELRYDQCKTDFTREEHFLTDCSWYQAGVQNKTMYGNNFWTRDVTTTAAGVTKSAPVFKSSTCWDVAQGKVPAKLPEPTVTSSSTRETRTLACGSGFTGSGRQQQRTKTATTTTFAWKQDPITNVTYSSWQSTSTSCAAINNTCHYKEGCGSGAGIGSGGDHEKSHPGSSGKNRGKD